MKVTVVGAGAVGATCADNIARKQLCDELVIVDIKEGVAEGKAMDLMQKQGFKKVVDLDGGIQAWKGATEK